MSEVTSDDERSGFDTRAALATLRQAQDGAQPVEAPAGAVSVWWHLLNAHADLIDDIGTALRERHDLSISEFDVLINLRPGEALRHKELVARVVLTRSAMTRLVDRLCARGLTTREPDADDQRGVRIRLTDAGEARRREAGITNATIVRDRFASFGEEDLRMLDRLLAKLDRPQQD